MGYALTEIDLSLPAVTERCQRHGGTDIAYLAHHHQRFLTTLETFDRTWDRRRGARVLDVGAHWLHQAVMWRMAGYAVTALDLPLTLELPSVRSLAEAEGIRLLPNADLEHCPALAGVPDDAFDVVLFTEILEHLTFNPVRFWREIHRVLAPGGRIVITTPNYYAWNGRVWHWGRFLTGFGGGLSVDEILGTHTYGHHWREFARKELIRYFGLLSPDFVTVKALTMRNYYPRSGDRVPFAERLFERIPWLRPNLHLEIELVAKRHGIVIEPRW